MCFSAQCWAAYHSYTREFGADISISDFARLYGYRRTKGASVKIPKAMDAAFAQPHTDQEREIRALIDEFNAGQARTWEAELFTQRKRLADAERALQVKTTKKAQEDQRIARDKIEQRQGWLAALHRRELIDDDSRIFPMWYAPVMISEGGRRVVKPMRYGCRLAGKPANYDQRFPGTYNSRRDNLSGYWKDAFGYSHGIMAVTRFFENVSRHCAEGHDLAPGEAEENVVLEFTPRPAHTMLVACLWSHWKGSGSEPDLLSFAAITDEPPPEVAAAGHDRCIVPIKPENIDRWLNPDPRDLDALQAILEDRDKPYYEHRMAA
ncbi:MAG TPA: SOS response-associated peptidase family protein [Nevskia sp.]|nr:SOS response-associated peptidase family protein [Nevskia sp.]